MPIIEEVEISPSFFKKIGQKDIARWIDKLTFVRILLVWLTTVIMFGLVYFFFKNGSSYLFYNTEGKIVDTIRDSIYFSFITATTTGFGDIVPFGFFKFIATAEVIFGLMLLAIVTSKLVSIKQDVILSELYDISLKEKVNRLRSSMLLFRQNLERVMSKIEDSSIQKREINSIYIYISSFEDVLSEILALTVKQGKQIFIKNIDTVSIELIFNSILSSFEKLNELMVIMNQKKIKWDTDINLLVLNKCLRINENLFNMLVSSKIATKEFLADLGARKAKVITAIKNEIALKETTAKDASKETAKEMPEDLIRGV